VCDDDEKVIQEVDEKMSLCTAGERLVGMVQT